MASSLSLNLDSERPRLRSSSPLSKARLAQTTLYSSRFHDILGEGGLAIFPPVFFTSSLAVKRVGKYRDQAFLKLRNMRGQKSKQRNMKALSLCLRLVLGRKPRKSEYRIKLVEETMSSERKGVPHKR